MLRVDPIHVCTRIYSSFAELMTTLHAWELHLRDLGIVDGRSCLCNPFDVKKEQSTCRTDGEGRFES